MSGMLHMNDNGLVPDCWLHLNWMGPIMTSGSIAFTARIEHPEHGRATLMVGSLQTIAYPAPLQHPHAGWHQHSITMGDGEFMRVDFDKHIGAGATYTKAVREPSEVAAIVAASAPLPRTDMPGRSWEREWAFALFSGALLGMGISALVGILAAGLGVL